MCFFTNKNNRKNFRFIKIRKKNNIFDNNKIIIQTSWDIINCNKNNLVTHFNEKFYENLYNLSNKKIDIKNIYIQINILLSIVKIIITNKEVVRNIYINNLKIYLQTNNITNEDYKNIQCSLEKTLQEILQEKCTKEVLLSWRNCCNSICKILKNTT